MLKSIFQVAADCGTDWQTIRDWAEFGTLPSPLVVGGLLRWRQSDLDSWVASGCPESRELTADETEPLWTALLLELQTLDAKGN